MIFGKSCKDNRKEDQDKLRNMQGKLKCFAWLPVKENHGRWVWMQYVYKDYGVYFDGLQLNLLYEKPIYHLTDE